MPIPELGGEPALVAAVEGVHRLGVGVTAYVNGRLADVAAPALAAPEAGEAVLA